MKTNCFFLSVLFACLLFTACENSTGAIGMGMQPDEDEITISDTVMYIEPDACSTIKMDSIYIETIQGLLGNMYDPDYGTINAGYIAQFYPPNHFPDSINGNKIDSVFLIVRCLNFYGDSLAPMEVSVYPVMKPLTGNFYTNINPWDYCDASNVLAKKAYTAAYDRFKVPLPDSLGYKFLNIYRENPNIYDDPDKFLEEFPGLYLRSTFGSGNLLQLDELSIGIFYRIDSEPDSAGNIIDSTVVSYQISRPELLQLNSIANDAANLHETDLLQPSSDKMYIKTPNGIYPRIVFPVRKLKAGNSQQRFSSVRMKIEAYTPTESKYAWSPPGATTTTTGLMLIEEDSVKSFFERKENRTIDGISTYTTNYDSSTDTYTFSNISNLIQKADADRDLNLLLIPIQIESTTSRVSNYFLPSAITLKKNIRIEAVTSELQRK